MTPRASFLVPWRTDAGPRERIFEHVRDRLRSMPGCQVIVSDDRGADPDLFNHGQAVNLASEAAEADVLVIADADTVPDFPQDLLQAVDQVAADRRWRVARRYVHLTESATETLLDFGGFDDGGIALSDAETVLDGLAWSGFVIVPREAFDLIGGADERYLGWGSDDVALATALTTLYGPCVRYPGASVHLWHPRGEQETGGHRHADAGRELTARYLKASGNEWKMRSVINEKRIR